MQSGPQDPNYILTAENIGHYYQIIGQLTHAYLMFKLAHKTHKLNKEENLDPFFAWSNLNPFNYTRSNLNPFNWKIFNLGLFAYGATAEQDLFMKFWNGLEPAVREFLGPILAKQDKLDALKAHGFHVMSDEDLQKLKAEMFQKALNEAQLIANKAFSQIGESATQDNEALKKHFQEQATLLFQSTLSDVESKMNLILEQNTNITAEKVLTALQENPSMIPSPSSWNSVDMIYNIHQKIKSWIYGNEDITKIYANSTKKMVDLFSNATLPELQKYATHTSAETLDNLFDNITHSISENNHTNTTRTLLSVQDSIKNFCNHYPDKTEAMNKLCETFSKLDINYAGQVTADFFERSTPYINGFRELPQWLYQQALDNPTQAAAIGGGIGGAALMYLASGWYWNRNTNNNNNNNENKNDNKNENKNDSTSQAISKTEIKIVLNEGSDKEEDLNKKNNPLKI